MLTTSEKVRTNIIPGRSAGARYSNASSLGGDVSNTTPATATGESGAMPANMLPAVSSKP